MFGVGYDGGAYSENGVRSNLYMGVFRGNFIKIQSNEHVFFFFSINVLDYALSNKILPSPFFGANFFDVFWL